MESRLAIISFLKRRLRIPDAPPALFWVAPVILFLLLCQIGFCLKALPRSMTGEVDFCAFYAAGRLLITGSGDHLYDLEAQRQMQQANGNAHVLTLPFLYPAYSALLFTPLAALSYQRAFLAFLGVNLLLLVMTCNILRSRLSLPRRGPAWLPVCLSLCSFPVSIALMQGQTSFVLLLLYTGCFALQRRGKDFLSGLVLSATLAKFQIALPIAFLFFLWRQWRIVAGFAVGTCIVALVSLLLSGTHGAVQYLHDLSGVLDATALEPLRAQARYGMFPADMPNLHGFMFLLTNDNRIVLLLTLVTSLCVIAWAARQRPANKLALAIPAAMLISYHVQAYDLTLLLLPLAIGADELWPQGACNSLRKAVALTSVSFLFVPLAPLLLVNGLCSLLAIAVFGALWLSRGQREARGLGSFFLIALQLD